jgi:SAM-dependent methyltransferase
MELAQMDPKLRANLENILACPKCKAPLTLCVDQCRCRQGHIYPRGPDIYAFAEKSFTDKYDSEDMAARYVQYAFAFTVARTVGVAPDGRSEGLYRTVSDICRGELMSAANDAPVIVDLACGVGRSIYDIASACSDAAVVGLDLSMTMARTAYRLCSGDPVPCGVASDGWPALDLTRTALPNVFVAQGDACVPPLRTVVLGSPGAMIVLSNMLIDRLRTSADVAASLIAAVDILVPGGLLVVTTPFNWTTEETWAYYGTSRTWLADSLTRLGLTVEINFDFLPYRECLDPFGTTFETPVQICAARKTVGIS